MSNDPSVKRAIGVVPPARVADAVRALVKEIGEVEASRRLDIGRATVTRLVASLPCRRGTIALAAARLGIEVER